MYFTYKKPVNSILVPGMQMDGSTPLSCGHRSEGLWLYQAQKCADSCNKNKPVLSPSCYATQCRARVLINKKIHFSPLFLFLLCFKSSFSNTKGNQNKGIRTSSITLVHNKFMLFYTMEPSLMQPDTPLKGHLAVKHTSARVHHPKSNKRGNRI